MFGEQTYIDYIDYVSSTKKASNTLVFPNLPPNSKQAIALSHWSKTRPRISFHLKDKKIKQKKQQKLYLACDCTKFFPILQPIASCGDEMVVQWIATFSYKVIGQIFWQRRTTNLDWLQWLLERFSLSKKCNKYYKFRQIASVFPAVKMSLCQCAQFEETWLTCLPAGCILVIRIQGEYRTGRLLSISENVKNWNNISRVEYCDNIIS